MAFIVTVSYGLAVQFPSATLTRAALLPRTKKLSNPRLFSLTPDHRSSVCSPLQPALETNAKPRRLTHKVEAGLQILMGRLNLKVSCQTRMKAEVSETHSTHGEMKNTYKSLSDKTVRGDQWISC